MDCNIFKKKLNDYMEDSIEIDMKCAMEKHISECDVCKEMYDEEVSIDEEFKNTFNIDGIEFSSSRAEIMNSIDKNRYSKNKTNKASFQIKKNKVKYMSIAAAIALVVISVPNIMNRYGNNGYKSDESNYEMALKSEKIEGKMNNTAMMDGVSDKVQEKPIALEHDMQGQRNKEMEKFNSNIKKDEIVEKSSDNMEEGKIALAADTPIQSNEIVQENKSSRGIEKYTADDYALENNAEKDMEITFAAEETYMPAFKKEKLDNSYKQKIKIENIVPWEESSNNKFSACIEGLKIESPDIGEGRLLIENKESGNIISYELVDNIQQLTPREFEWWDDENLLLVIGYGYGTISQGGKVYSLNIDTGKLSLVYDANTNKEQVTKITKNKKNIKFDILMYEDDSLNEYHMETGIVKDYKLSVPNVINITLQNGTIRTENIN